LYPLRSLMKTVISISLSFFLFRMLRLPPRPPLFPYTTLFRSGDGAAARLPAEQLRQRVRARLGDLPVLLRGDAADADAADELAVHDERQPALDRHRVGQRHDDVPAAGGRVFEDLRGTLVGYRASRLRDGDVNAARLRVVDPLEVDEMAAVVDDDDDHAPVVLRRLGFGGAGELLG